MMHRPLPEIIASQKKMPARSGKEGGRFTDQVSRYQTDESTIQPRGVLDPPAAVRVSPPAA